MRICFPNPHKEGGYSLECRSLGTTRDALHRHACFSPETGLQSCLRGSESQRDPSACCQHPPRGHGNTSGRNLAPARPFPWVLQIDGAARVTGTRWDHAAQAGPPHPAAGPARRRDHRSGGARGGCECAQQCRHSGVATTVGISDRNPPPLILCFSEPAPEQRPQAYRPAPDCCAPRATGSSSSLPAAWVSEAFPGCSLLATRHHLGRALWQMHQGTPVWGAGTGGPWGPLRPQCRVSSVGRLPRSPREA